MIDAAVRGCHIIEWPPDSGKYLRANGDPDNPWSEKNTRQHREVLDQVTGADRGRFLDWFATLPLWLDLGDLRVIHACWHEPSISVVQQRCGTSTPFGELSHLVDAITEGDPLHHAVETLLTGPENLVEHGQPEYRDKYVFRGTTRGCGGGTVARRRCVTSQRWGELHHRLRAAVSGATRTGTGRCREFRQDGGVYVTVGGYVLTHRSTVCVFEQPPTLTSQPDAELAEAE